MFRETKLFEIASASHRDDAHNLHIQYSKFIGLFGFTEHDTYPELGIGWEFGEGHLSENNDGDGDGYGDGNGEGAGDGENIEGLGRGDGNGDGNGDGPWFRSY